VFITEARTVSTITDQAESLRFALGASVEFGWPATNPRAMNHLAENLGHDVARSAHASNLKEAVEALSTFWEENGFGRLSFQGGKQPMIKIKRCYDCVEWRTGVTSVPCTFKGTLLRVALEDLIGHEVRLTEVACCRTGAQSCNFRIITRGKP
jgi:predicted hydrocarbon binding protein